MIINGLQEKNSKVKRGKSFFFFWPEGSDEEEDPAGRDGQEDGAAADGRRDRLAGRDNLPVPEGSNDRLKTTIVTEYIV